MYTIFSWAEMLFVEWLTGGRKKKLFLIWYHSVQEVLHNFNSLRQSDTYMHQYTMPPLVQIMACCMYGTKMGFCQLDPKEHISVRFN